jgi:hypothetical protein
MRKLTQEQYERELNRAWDWYNWHIAYKPNNYEVEFVLLQDRYAGKTAIKIPVEKDTREYRAFIESEMAIHGQPISIRKLVFTSEYSYIGEARKYRVYLYRPA